MDWRDHVDSDQSLIRPSEIMIGLANPLKAEKKLGWKAIYGMNDVINEMIKEDQIFK